MFKEFKSFVLYIFVLLDVISYNAEPIVQSIITISIYSFLLVSIIKSFEISVMYFVAFNILCIGLGNSQPEVLYNYWGFRIGFISLNMVYVILYLIFSFLKFGFFSKELFKDKIHLFFLAYILYASLTGLINLTIGGRYFDNYIEDVMTFLPALFFIIILRILNSEEFRKILIYSVIATSLQMIFSFIFDKKFFYGPDLFIVNNSIYLIYPFALILLRKHFNAALFYFMLFSFAFFAISQNYFISGKTIVLIIIMFFWITFRSWKSFLIYFIPLILLFVNMRFILNGAESYFSELPAVAFKFGQINDAISYFSDPFLFAELPTSFSNLVAELLTVSKHLYNHPLGFIFGNGFGATIPDYWGFLEHFVGDGGGYKLIDMERNAYFKMHLPIYDIALKGGIVFLIQYFILLKNAFFKNKKSGILHFIMMFTIFALSKEALLLTLVIYYSLDALGLENRNLS